MQYRVDEKGKVFTEHVTKRTVLVILGIGGVIMRGMLHLKLDNRLKDELNDSERFIALTDVRVMDARDERVLYSTGALIVNKDQIAWIFERDSTSPTPNDPSYSESSS